MTASDTLVKERKLLQIAEALGSFNRWIAGVNLGHNPTDRECIWWYIEHGGSDDFAKRHPTLVGCETVNN